MNDKKLFFSAFLSLKNQTVSLCSQAIFSYKSLLFPLFLLVMAGCSDRVSKAPPLGPDVIESSPGGRELIEQESDTEDTKISQCNEDPNNNPYGYRQALQGSYSNYVEKQLQVDRDFPRLYSSLDKDFPLRGSWRKTKDEILDVVNKWLWSPEKGKPVQMLSYFDMVLMINTSQRYTHSSENSSAQRMQILARNGESNDLQDWDLIEVWPVSTGTPCGKKIETPTGVYKLDPLRFHNNYHSYQFENIKLFETMFLHHNYQNGRLTGVAIHGTYATEKLGRKASGGCIRVYRDRSKCLFNTIRGDIDKPCLKGGYLNYYGTVPSFLSRNGEADPEFYSKGLETEGFKVLVAIFNDGDDLLYN